MPLFMLRQNCFLFYLSSSNDANINKEIEYKIGKASSSFDNFYHIILNSLDVSLTIQIDLFKPEVLISLLYCAESCALYRRHINQHDVYHIRCLHIIRYRKLSVRIRNSEIQAKYIRVSIEGILMKTNSGGQDILLAIADIQNCSSLVSFEQAGQLKAILRFKTNHKENQKG